MQPVSTSPCAEAQADIAAWLDEMLADLTLEPAPVFVRESSPIDPRWKAILDRKRAGAARRAAIRARYGAPQPPAAANDDAPARPPAADAVRAAFGNKPVRRRSRRSQRRQRADAGKMRAAAKGSKGEVVETLSPGPSPLPCPCASTSPARSRTPTHQSVSNIPTQADGNPTSKGKQRRPRGLAAWEDAGELPRLIAANRALDKFGVPYAFSLNLGPEIIAAANDNARGFLDHVRRRVALTLKRTLGASVPFWFVIETDDDGRPHLHGGLPLYGNLRPDVIERALAKAGGNWTRQGSAPADLRWQYDQDGWVLYCLKRPGRTRADLRRTAGLGPNARVPLATMTHDLRAEAQRLHATIRHEIAAAEQIATEARTGPSRPGESLTPAKPAVPASESLCESEPHPGRSVPGAIRFVTVAKTGVGFSVKETTVKDQSTLTDDKSTLTDRLRARHIGACNQPISCSSHMQRGQITCPTQTPKQRGGSMHIVDTAKFRAFAEAAARLKPSPFTGERDPDEIKILLVEHLDVVPWSIFIDGPGNDDDPGERAVAAA